MYYKKFEVRWSDLDPNAHLANSAYLNFMSHTRTSYLNAKGFTPHVFIGLNCGPILLSERITYFKEFLPGDVLFVGMALSGVSENDRYYEFEHRFYDRAGENRSFGRAQGSWLDLRKRRLTVPPEDLMGVIRNIPRSADFRILKRTELRDQRPRAVHADQPFDPA